MKGKPEVLVHPMQNILNHHQAKIVWEQVANG